MPRTGPDGRNAGPTETGRPGPRWTKPTPQADHHRPPRSPGPGDPHDHRGRRRDRLPAIDEGDPRPVRPLTLDKHKLTEAMVVGHAPSSALCGKVWVPLPRAGAIPGLYGSASGCSNSGPERSPEGNWGRERGAQAGEPRAVVPSRTPSSIPCRAPGLSWRGRTVPRRQITEDQRIEPQRPSAPSVPTPPGTPPGS